MSCRIYLIRHGETLWNKAMKFQGHMDIPLSENGTLQAKALAHRLSSKKIAAVYSSDLERAMETALQVAKPHGLEVERVPGLREINFGQWEGLTYHEIKEKQGELIENWWKSPLNTRIPGGEDLSAMADRVTVAVKKIVEKHQGEQAAVVCHGGTVRCLVASLLHMDLNKYWKIRQDNASLNILEFPVADWDSGVVVLLNDRNHLPVGPGLTHWTKKMSEKSR